MSGEHHHAEGDTCIECGLNPPDNHGVCHTCFNEASAREVHHAGRPDDGDSMKDIIKKGITTTNPVFILLLGLCPALAVSTSLDNAIGMSAAVLFVLFGSNLIVASIRHWVPDIVRIPTFIVIIATFVTIIHLSMQAFSPPLSRSLGIYVPLIVVNCIILGRAEAFASKNNVKDSFADALGIGAGFFGAIFLVSLVRELLGTGTLQVFGTKLAEVPGLVDYPLGIFVMPMGAFMVLGMLLATFRYMGVMECE